MAHGPLASECGNSKTNWHAYHKNRPNACIMNMISFPVILLLFVIYSRYGSGPRWTSASDLLPLKPTEMVAQRNANPCPWEDKSATQ